jgi:hypothetical protein
MKTCFCFTPNKGWFQFDHIEGYDVSQTELADTIYVAHEKILEVPNCHTENMGYVRHITGF